MPSDVTGANVIEKDENGKLNTIFRRGPIFANLVLADEINRATPKTQSAMLEAMQERQVTIGRETHKMPQDIFLVIATQNPIEQEGTYPLSEAQTDRFMLKEKINYPSAEDEVEILNRTESGAITRRMPAVVTIQDIANVQTLAGRVYVDDAIKRYISYIVDATRHAENVLPEEMSRYVRMGASPRASIAFLKIAKAVALLYGRTYVTPEDVKMLRHQVLRHRITLSYAAVADHVDVETVIDRIVGAVRTP